MAQQILLSVNRRYLQYTDGRPFFWLADTAWELFHRYNFWNADYYLRKRAAQGFTVIQAVILAELDGVRTPNANGDLPLHDLDPTKPNEAYFAYVDQVVDLAASLGLTIAMLPTWGDKWNKAWGEGPEIFNPENARIFGEYMGRRYKDSPIIWVLGGDRPIATPEHRVILDAMAAGINAGTGRTQLMTLHPFGSHTSGRDVHDAEWLDFNMWQSGHDRNRGNFDCITEDYERIPTKPCVDGEPGYEDHPAGFNIDNGYLEAYDCRKSLYWALFAGAFGHTYGCHPIWQMAESSRPPFYSSVRTAWREALDLPGATQMRFAKDLLLSRPFFTRIPDQSLVITQHESKARRIVATRDIEGSYALIYFPTGEPTKLNLTSLSAEALRATWFNPRTGTTEQVAEFERQAEVAVQPPQFGPDWVLIFDDPSANYPLADRN